MRFLWASWFKFVYGPDVGRPSRKRRHLLLLISGASFSWSRCLSLAACRCIFCQVQTRTVDRWVLIRIENVVPFPRSVNHLEREVCDSCLYPLMENKRASNQPCWWNQARFHCLRSEAVCGDRMGIQLRELEAQSRGHTKEFTLVILYMVIR